MIYVTKGAYVEPLVQVSNIDVVQEIGGSLTLSLTSLNVPNNPGHVLLGSESVITVEDMDYRIKQYQEFRTHKDITATSTFFDLLGTRRNTYYENDVATFQDYCQFVFENTTWSFTTQINSIISIPQFGHSNIVDLLNTLCKAYGAVYIIRPNKNVYIYDKTAYSADNDFQYRYGYNVQALSVNEDTTSLKTFIRGTGAIGITSTYTAPTAAQFGIREADPIEDNEIENVNELNRILSQSIVSEPQISLELDSIELLDKEVGEGVWLIYEPLDIELKTSIMSTSKTMRNGRLMPYKVTLGNSVPKNASDLFVETRYYIEKNKKLINNSISNFQKSMQRDMENLMVLGVPEIY